MTPRTVAKWDDCLGIDAVEPLHSLQQPGRSVQAVVAGYELSESGSRSGGLYLVEVETSQIDIADREDGNTERTQETHFGIREISSIRSIAGVLDVSVSDLFDDDQCSADGASVSPTIVLAACADGTVHGCAVQGQLQPSWILNLHEDSSGPAVILSVDCPQRQSASKGQGSLACASDASGSVHVFRVGHESARLVTRIKNAHLGECWTSAIRADYAMGDDIFSGGDDGTLAVWDLRVSANTTGALCGQTECSKAVVRFRAPHGGVGVTSLLLPGRYESSSLPSHKFYSGGYDDTLRLWDIRSPRSCVNELNVGGGVWRIKANPRDDNVLLLACMYDGCKVVRRETDDSLHLVTEYREHKSLAYGAAWLQFENSDHHVNVDEFNKSDATHSATDMSQHSFCEYVLTGSFYDHSLHMWTYYDQFCRAL